MRIVSVDLEDWFETGDSGIGEPEFHAAEDRLETGTRRILDLLEKKGIKATFFCLGAAARRRPDIIREIAGSGHEIASHGFSHRRFDRISIEEAAAEIERAEEAIDEAVGIRPIGFRAPDWSIGRGNIEVLEILAEKGYEYDSSMMPSLIPGYGGFGLPVKPLIIHLPSGGRITELPGMTMGLGPFRLPACGGFSLRLFGSRINRRALRSDYGHISVHPWEADPGRPIRSRFPFSFIHSWNLKATIEILDSLLDGGFGPVSEACQSVSRSARFP